MDRRGFMGCGVAAAVEIAGRTEARADGPAKVTAGNSSLTDPARAENYRDLFPRLSREIYLNAASGIPQSAFAKAAAREFEDFWSLGPGDGRREKLDRNLREVRERFAGLIGATPPEIAFVQNTKAGEQIAIDCLPSLRSGGNIVTNDLHFAGSLHNLIGLGKSGLDVRIVKSENWSTSVDAMTRQIDGNTSLVCLSLVSNINGHLEPVRRIADHARQNGAMVYADIIQAAGIVPVDVREMGIDFAACSGYKWLFGTHGAGFFYAAREHQGKTLTDKMFPGHARHLYEPWTRPPENPIDDFEYHPRDNATRYQTGHLSYYGLTVLNAALRFILEIGVERLSTHTFRLIQRLVDQVDGRKARSISPVTGNGPIVTFLIDDTSALRERLSREKIVVGISNNRVRVSPAIYNNQDDIDRLARVLNG